VTAGSILALDIAERISPLYDGAGFGDAGARCTR
jgi:hypothetical protein